MPESVINNAACESSATVATRVDEEILREKLYSGKLLLTAEAVERLILVEKVLELSMECFSFAEVGECLGISERVATQYFFLAIVFASSVSNL